MSQPPSKQFFSSWINGPRVLLRALFHPTGSLWRYCLLVAPLAIIPSVIFSAVIFEVFEALGVSPSALLPHGPDPTFNGFLGTVVCAPIIETFVLAWTLSILSSINKGDVFAAAGAAVLWGLIHALGGVLWFFGTVWSFFVFSAAYLAWRPISFKHAFVAAAMTHALVNLTVMVWIFADSPNRILPKVVNAKPAVAFRSIADQPGGKWITSSHHISPS